MEPQASPEFVIGQMRVLTMSETVFFYVTNQPIPFADLDRDLDVLLLKLEAALALARIAEAGPTITRYYRADAAERGRAGPALPAPADQPDLFLMEVGVPVRAGTQPAGEALVKTLAPYRCAALLYWGSLEHIAEAHMALIQGMQAAGLEPTGEGREWNYHFESVTSPHNILGLCMGIR
jgi:hypothetical protein